MVVTIHLKKKNTTLKINRKNLRLIFFVFIHISARKPIKIFDYPNFDTLGNDIVNIGLHFILKNVRPYAAPCSEA